MRLALLRTSTFLLLVTSLAASASAQSTRRDDPNPGRLLYLEHCASCHGTSGIGDGPAARTLRTPLPDLTRIAERNAGVFPTDTVSRIVDGRTPVAGHLRDGMPLWGTIFSRLEGGDQKAARVHVDALVAHIKSMQRAQADH